MSIYSNYMVGNVVVSVNDIKKLGYYFIVDRVSENGIVTFIRSIQTNEIFSVQSEDIFPADFQPSKWGFNEIFNNHYKNSELLLHHFTDISGYAGSGVVEEVINGVTEEWEIDGVAIFSHIGYKVKRIDSDEWLIDGTEIEKDEYSSNDKARFVGLRYVHEYQNLYSKEFPHIKLDLNPINAKS